jgi:hypothetical protein
VSQKLNHELEKPESWDYERPQTKKPVKASRVVVSVPFRGDDFWSVSECAERAGKKTSVFIREAAIDKAKGQITLFQPFDGGSTGGMLVAVPTQGFTLASGSSAGQPYEEKAITHAQSHN